MLNFINKPIITKMFVSLSVFSAVVFASISIAFASDEDSESFYGSLKREEVNVRKGPGTQYPILWVFKRKGWPVEVVNSYNNWYKVKDVDGESGWVFSGMVSKKLTALTSDKEKTTLYKNSNGTYPLVKFEPYIVLDVQDCNLNMCNVKYKSYEGWVQKSDLLMLNK